MERWYLIKSGRNVSITPLVRMLLLFRTRNRSMIEDECSVKFVGSYINSCMLYACISSFILLLLSFSIFNVEVS